MSRNSRELIYVGDVLKVNDKTAVNITTEIYEMTFRNSLGVDEIIERLRAKYTDNELLYAMFEFGKLRGMLKVVENPIGVLKWFDVITRIIDRKDSSKLKEFLAKKLEFERKLHEYDKFLDHLYESESDNDISVI